MPAVDKVVNVTVIHSEKDEALQRARKWNRYVVPGVNPPKGMEVDAIGVPEPVGAFTDWFTTYSKLVLEGNTFQEILALVIVIPPAANPLGAMHTVAVVVKVIIDHAEKLPPPQLLRTNTW